MSLYFATWSIMALASSPAHTYTKSGDKGGPDPRRQRAHEQRDTAMRKSTWAAFQMRAVVAFWNDPTFNPGLTSGSLISNSLHGSKQ